MHKHLIIAREKGCPTRPTGYRSIEKLKSSDQRTVLESWPSEIETLNSEQAVCNVRYLFAYSKTFLLGNILQIFKNKHYTGEENIMLQNF